MPPAQKIISSDGMSGVVNLKRSKIPGRKGETKWRKKYAVLKVDTLHLYEGHDENGKGEDESYTVYLSKYKECTHIMDKKGRKKPGFMLMPTDPTYEQWTMQCEDITQQEKWISQLNSAIAGNVITIINFDDLTVQTPALHHFGKTRPKCKGRRAPSKRPRTVLSEANGEVYAADDLEAGVTAVDSVNPAKKPRSELTTSPVKTPEESKASGAKAFFRGIGLKFSTALGRQRSVGAKTPQSPEPEGARATDVAPEERMSLSSLLRTLQRIEDQSGTIINKAAALRVLFQGTAEDSASLGRPALEVEKGLQSITSTLEHLNLAEDLQLKVKEDEERERLEREENARLKREADEAKRKEEEEDRKKREAEEAEQRRREEEEQDLKDQEEQKKEEERLKREEEERKAKEEVMRLAKEAEEEEEKMWQSEDEDKAESKKEEEEAEVPKETPQEESESNKTSEDNQAPAAEKPMSEETKMDLDKQEESPSVEPDEDVKMDSEDTQEDTLKPDNIEPKDELEVVEENEDKTPSSPKTPTSGVNSTNL